MQGILMRISIQPAKCNEYRVYVEEKYLVIVALFLQCLLVI